MRPLTAIGLIFAGLVAFLLVGLGILRGSLLAPQSWQLAALGLGWLVGLWGALVAFMVFLILWVGQQLAALEAERPAQPVALGQPSVDGAATQASAAPARREPERIAS